MKRPAQNILAVFGSDGAVRLLGFIATAYMARQLEPGAFGILNFGTAVLSYGVLFSSPGLHIIGALRVADKSVAPSLLVRTITALRALLAVVFCLIAFAVFAFGTRSPLTAAAFFFSCALLPISLQLEWYFQGSESLTVTGVAKIAASLIFAGGILLALTPVNFEWFVPMCYGTGMLIQAIVLGLFYVRSRHRSDNTVSLPDGEADESAAETADIAVRAAAGLAAGSTSGPVIAVSADFSAGNAAGEAAVPAAGTSAEAAAPAHTHATHTSRYSWRTAVRQALPVGAAVIAAQALLNFPSLALGIVSTTEDVARFSAAAKLVFFVLAIDRVMYAMFFPFVARTHANAPLSLPQHLERITKYIFLLCVPVCIGGSVLAGRILSAVYGAQYEAAAPLLQIQLWYFFLTILNSLFSYPLIAIGRERYYGAATTAVAVGTIVLLLPLVYAYSAIGASVGLVVGEAALVAAMAAKAGALFPTRSFAHIVKPLAASLAMACFLVIFSYISLFLLIPAAAAVYLLASLALKAVDRHDILFLKERLV